MLSENINLLTCSMNAIIRKIAAKNNLSISQYFTLHSISTNGISMTELSKLLGIDNSTLTRNINILTRMLLVSKLTSEEDKRSYNIFLTESGYSTLNIIEKEMNIFIQLILDNLKDDENEFLNEVISKLNWKINSYINDL